MPEYIFRLLERHQRLDERLRLVQAGRVVDPFEILRLKTLKILLKDRLTRLARSPLTIH